VTSYTYLPGALPCRYVPGSPPAGERRLRAMRVLPPTAYAKQTTRLGGPDHNLSQIAADRELDVARASDVKSVSRAKRTSSEKLRAWVLSMIRAR